MYTLLQNTQVLMERDIFMNIAKFDQITINHWKIDSYSLIDG